MHSSANYSLIFSYFEALTPTQKEQIAHLGSLYSYWNSRINVVSRKDIEELYLRHVLHSLGIARVHKFSSQQQVLDVGTGGGFPGIPLAILFPHTRFTLVDSIGKKIKVVKEISASLRLKNVEAVQTRAEHIEGKFEVIVSRAVTRMKPFYGWVKDKLAPGGQILYLKGGDVAEEMAELGLPYQVYPLHAYFSEPFFETKKVIRITQTNLLNKN